MQQQRPFFYAAGMVLAPSLPLHFDLVPDAGEQHGTLSVAGLVESAFQRIAAGDSAVTAGTLSVRFVRSAPTVAGSRQSFRFQVDLTASDNALLIWHLPGGDRQRIMLGAWDLREALQLHCDAGRMLGSNRHWLIQASRAQRGRTRVDLAAGQHADLAFFAANGWLRVHDSPASGDNEPASAMIEITDTGRARVAALPPMKVFSHPTLGVVAFDSLRWWDYEGGNRLSERAAPPVGKLRRIATVPIGECRFAPAS